MGAKLITACKSQQGFTNEDIKDIIDFLKQGGLLNGTNEKEAINEAVQNSNAINLLSHIKTLIPADGAIWIMPRLLDLLECVDASSWSPIVLPFAIDVALFALDTRCTNDTVHRGAETLTHLFNIAREAGLLVELTKLLEYLEYEYYNHTGEVLKLIDVIAQDRRTHNQIAEHPRVIYIAMLNEPKGKTAALDLLLKLAANTECYPHLGDPSKLDIKGIGFGTAHKWKLSHVLVRLFPEKYALEIVISAIKSATKQVQKQYVDENELFELVLQDSVLSVLMNCNLPHLLMELVKKDNNSQAARILVLIYKEQPIKLFNLIMESGIEESRLPSEFFGVIISTWTARASVTDHLRDKEAPWYVDPDLLPPNSEQQKFTIISAPPRACAFLADLYGRNPVPGHDIKSVRIVVSNKLHLLFAGRVGQLEKQHGKSEYDSHWEQSSTTSEELTQRKQIMDQFRSLASRHQYSKAPHVSLLPLWHGTNPAALESLFTTGFANLASTDAGFFGKGIYATAEPEYAFRVYSSGALLVNWTAVFSPFPVIAQDEEHLTEKGNFENYDAHFAPVFSPKHPKTSNYHACEAHQKAQYTELVVFDSAQVLPHYIVELQPSLIPNPSTPSIKSGTLKPILKPFPSTAVSSWTVSDVCSWVSKLALSQQYHKELENHNVDGNKLLTMTKEEWKRIGVLSFGDIRKLSLGLSRLG